MDKIIFPQKRKLSFNNIARSSSDSLFPSLWDGLIGMWLPILGNQGNMMFDFSNTKNHAMLFNMHPKSWSFGKRGSSLIFDGTDDYALVSNPHRINEWSSLSVTIAFKANANQVQYSRLWEKGANDELALFWSWTAGDDKLSWRFNNAAQVVSTNALADGQWHVITAVAIQTAASVYTALLYVDGRLDVSESLSTGTLTKTGAINFMRYGGGAFTGSGFIDFCLVHDRSLRLPEIRLLSNYKLPAEKRDKIIFFQFPPSAVLPESTVFSTITSIGRIQRQYNNNIQSISRIQKTLSRDINSIGRIEKTITNFTSSLARIEVLTKDQQASIARILTENNIDINSISRISTTISKFINSAARIETQDIKVIESIARIAILLDSNVSSIARILRSLQKSIESIARISKTQEISQDSIARILRSFNSEQQSISRIQKSLNKYINSVSRILNTQTVTKESLARIEKSFEGYQTSIATIIIQYNKTLTSVARILTSNSRSITSIAYLISGASGTSPYTIAFDNSLTTISLGSVTKKPSVIINSTRTKSTITHSSPTKVTLL